MTQHIPQDDAERFSQQASGKRLGATRELVDFLRHNKKWWLAPIVIMLLVVGGLVILAGTSAAPFIYTLF
ncbi:MAG TPA: DUF5989 family protein [Pirellulales bacterium]|jgi:hypothetical protein|nr:DUF5989 family protein [Pirellulales bacterium]